MKTRMQVTLHLESYRRLGTSGRRYYLRTALLVLAAVVLFTAAPGILRTASARGEAQLIASVNGGPCALSFLTHKDYGTGTDSQPNSVATGDFNGDGKPDIAVGTYAETVSVLLNNGAGTFSPQVSYSVPNTPRSVAVGDINSDGKLDIVTGNNNSSISVLLGNGNGTFQSHVDYTVGAQPRDVEVADFNADGKPDIATATGSTNNIGVLLNNGNGTFGAPTTFAAGTFPNSLAVGDFNKDGKRDIAAANGGSNNLSVLLGNGNGTFQAQVTYTTVQPSGGIETTDLNGDTYLDLVLVSEGNKVKVLLNNGNGTYGSPADYPVGNGPDSVAVGDFNGDGKQDVATSNSVANDVSVLLGNGNGTLGNRADYGTGTNSTDVAAADFNSDGKTDIVNVNNANGTVSVLLATGNGAFDTHRDFPTSDGPIGVAVADFNKDGRLDMATANYGTRVLNNFVANNTVSVLLGSGGGLFNTHVEYTVGTGPVSVAAGDFNGDTKPDLVTANVLSNNISVLLGNGNGTFQSHVEYATGENPISVAVGDLNADGNLDVATVDSDAQSAGDPGHASIFLGKGDGTFNPRKAYALVGGSDPRHVALGDLNGDQKLDLIAANGLRSSLSVLLGNGDGTFGPVTEVPTGSGMLANQVDLGDLNGDQKLDIVVANLSSYVVGVLIGNGDGTFQPHVDYEVGALPMSVAVEDFNGDAKLDVAVTNQGSSKLRNMATLTVLLGNGDGTFTHGADYGPGHSGEFVEVGDFNGDNWSDIVTANNAGDNVSILLNTNGCIVPPVTATPTPPTPPNGCTTDFFDVPSGSTFYNFVKCLACRQILGGYSDGTFRPQNQITRGQIAKIVSNAAGYSDDVSGRQTYTDVPSAQPFHAWIERLSTRGHMGGYNCGGTGEPCDGANRPYFRPGANASRGQLSKIVSNAAGFTDTPEGQTFEDVPTSSTFYLFIERLTTRGVMSGYPCGSAGEPCSGWNMPYFRPSSNVTRGQASKIVANTFFPECSTSTSKKR